LLLEVINRLAGTASIKVNVPFPAPLEAVSFRDKSIKTSVHEDSAGR